MQILLSVLILICAVLLIGVVLLQKSKGGGLAAGFDSGNKAFGVRTATSFVERATWTLAIAICVLSIASAFFTPNSVVTSRVSESPKQEVPQAFGTQTEQNAQPAAPAAPAQSAPAAPVAPAAPAGK